MHIPYQSTHHNEGFAIVGLDPLIHPRPVQDAGHEVVADALDLVRPQTTLVVQVVGQGEDGAPGVHADDPHVGRVLLQPGAEARDGPPGARAGHHHVDPAVQLLQELGGGPIVVGERIGGIRVLIENVRIGGLFLELVGDGDVTVRGILRMPRKRVSGGRCSSSSGGIM